MIKLYSNRKVEPSSIIMANQHENMTRVLEFNLEQVPNGYRYLVLTNSSGSNLYLITDNKVDITSAFTWNGQTYEANVVVSNIELENELVSTNVLWISNTFRLQVRRNNINAEELSKLPIPPDLQMPYDKLLQLIEDVEGKLENGEFNGKDGIGIKSIEKTGSEGLVDTYTITLTDDSTFVYSVTNGRDGIDGKSAYELAVENGFEGNVDEWLASLDYEHSEEFEQLAEQVKNDAKKSASNASTASAAAQSAATNAGAALNSANAASQSAADASVSATQAQQAAQEAENSKTSAETASSNAQQSAQSAEENANKAQEIADSLDPTIFAIKETTQGNPTIISDSADWRLQKLNVYGQSEQDSTTGAQLLSLDMLTNKLPYSVNGITFSDNGDGGIKVTGTATGVATLYFNDIINNLEDGETYSYNSDTELGTLYVSYNDGTPIDYIKTITVNKSKMISIKPYAQYTSGNTVNKVIYPMLNIGNSGKPSPSPDYPQEIKNKEISKISVCNENLLSLDIDTRITNEEVYFYRNLGFTLKKGIRYVLSVKSIVVGLYAIPFGGTLPEDSPFKKYDSDTLEFTPTETGKYYFHAYNPNGITDEQKILWLNVGEKKPYTEHVSEQITLPEPITLRGIPVASGGNVTIDGQQYISDVICEKDGVIGVERRCYPKELKIADMNNSEDFPGWCNIDDIYIFAEDGKTGALNNRLLNITTKLNTVFYNTIKTDTYTNKNLYLSKALFDNKTQTEIKESYPNLTVVFVFERVEPTFEPLPEEVQAQYKALKSYYPNTVIQSGAFNEVTYVADTKTWIENKINGVTELALGIGGK